MWENFTFSFNKAGHHDVKAGGEYLHTLQTYHVCNSCVGQYDAQGGATPANVEALFPNLYDADTWNISALNPIVRRYSLGVGEYGEYNRTRVHIRPSRVA